MDQFAHFWGMSSPCVSREYFPGRMTCSICLILENFTRISRRSLFLTIKLSSKFDFVHQTQKPKIFAKFIFVHLADLKIVLDHFGRQGQHVVVGPHVISLLFLFLIFASSLSSTSTSHDRLLKGPKWLEEGE